MKFALSIAWSLSLLSGLVFAKPEVLADFGGQQSPYPTAADIKASLAQQAQSVEPPRLQLPPSRYPMRSHLTVGVVEPYSHNMTVSRPLFILGSDDLSIEWLVSNRQHLASINAMGIVTNVDSGAAVDRIKSLVPELTIVAVPVDEFTRLYKLTHYPVLIDQEGVKQ